MSGLHWLQPGWLLLGLLPLPLLLWRRRGPGHARLERFVQRHLWARVLSAPLRASRSRQLGFILAWLLLSLALAGPFWVQDQARQVQRLAANIVIVMDISPSMGARDVHPSRLDQAKKLVSDFSLRMEQHRLALVAFSANAYTVLPLTPDGAALRHFLQQLDPSLAYVTGSNLGRGLRLAREALDQALDQNASGGLVLLVSDGEIHDPGAIQAAGALGEAGHTLLTLGIGTVQGAPVPLAGGRLLRREGEVFTSQLQRDTLRQLAQAGGGRYFDLQPGAWPEIEGEIEQLQRSAFQSQVQTQMGRPLFPVLILLALVPLFWQILQRPQGLVLVVMGGLLLPPGPAEAAPWTEAKGLDQLKQNNNQSALEIYSELDNYAGLMGKGVAAYRLGQWQRALQAFEQAYALAEDDRARARAAYNRGNTLVRLRRLEPAIQAFEQAVALQGSYSRASLNLTLLRQARQGLGTTPETEAEQPRPGPGQTETERGSGGEAETAPRAGEDETTARLSGTQAEADGARDRRDQALAQSLARWSQLPEAGPQAPLRAWQQYRALEEDNRPLLRRRFEIEDKRALGRVEEKPW